MVLLRKRNCPECGAEMHPQLINLLYKRENYETQIDVIGIPANVCTKCFYRIIPGRIAKYIDSIIDPIFDSEPRQQDKILPAPHIDIQFQLFEEEGKKAIDFYGILKSDYPDYVKQIVEDREIYYDI